MLFVVRRFTYRTWLFHVGVLTGITLALVGLMSGGTTAVGIAALVLGTLWFAITWRELRIASSSAAASISRVQMPPFTATTTHGVSVTEADLVARAPTLLVLYRGWWCPSSRAQLDEVSARRVELTEAGVSIYAGSVDSPAQSAPMQDHVGPQITILCDVQDAFLDELGSRDGRGAPWYDRLRFGAAKRPIATPTALALDRTGTIISMHRSSRVDEQPLTDDLIAALIR